ncbi:tetratricopeptide repeat protein [Pseudomonas sp. AA-38]|uniref:tetratricopeptide repeat protein n=1 Tax=Pseudomonas sp. AA-38 TaxID=3028807 RepID=UPI0023F9E589|nr:tetratricopeptide repeat protein [Pseudomonas sp. AA-38]
MATTRGLCLIFFAAHVICGGVFAQSMLEQESAKAQGLKLYNQYMGVSAVEPLRIAAEAGDKTAQYYLGETLRLNNMFMTPEAQKWYEAAAKQGDLFAMLRLGDSNDLCHSLGTCAGGGPDWREKALSLAYEDAEQGDTEAMRVLYHAGEGLVWLQKAAEAGDSSAQQQLASRYKAGEGWFLTTGSRKKEIIKWLKRSAEKGFAPGMFEYSLAIAPDNVEEASKWLVRAANLSYVNAVVEYAANLGGLSETYKLPQDFLRGSALMRMVVDISPGDTIRLEMLKEIEQEMNENELAKSQLLTDELRAKLPPLSYFVPVYGH